MKILYITPKINNEGGVARALSVKTNYLIEKLGYDVAIVSQNGDNSEHFFKFNFKIQLFDIKLSNNRVKFYFEYKKQIKNILHNYKPDLIIVCDNGLKGFLFPILIKTSIPILLEVHGSKYNEVNKISDTIFSNFLHQLKYKTRNYGAKKFDYFVALSNESASEWNIENPIIIPNPIENKEDNQAVLNSKKAIVISRNSYEKGLDRLFPIWQKVVEINNDWLLEIIGVDSNDEKLVALISEFNLSENILLTKPQKNIHDKYLQASLYLMTSRNEGFPMVLLEAMSFGLPCIAYDCPIGPRAIITNNENGFLIEDGNSVAFAEKVKLLISDSELRSNFGNFAKKSIQKFDIEIVMNQWNSLFRSINIKL